MTTISLQQHTTIPFAHLTVSRHVRLLGKFSPCKQAISSVMF